MEVYNTYSSIMFSPELMRRAVGELAHHLPGLMKEFDFDTIVVTGKSGCALGFALSMVTDVNVVYVRKGESSHGDMVEGRCGHTFSRYAFFDDMVSSGKTRKRVHKELVKYTDSRVQAIPERVLTILYSSYYTHSGLEYDCDSQEPEWMLKDVLIIPPTDVYAWREDLCEY